MDTEKLRYFLKDFIRDETNFATAHQQLGLPEPPPVKEVRAGQKIIPLPNVSRDCLSNNDLFDCLTQRQSRRRFSREPLSLEELGWLLYAVQGMPNPENFVKKRVVPSAGNRHSLETYLALFRAGGLEQGIYRYLPDRHALVLERCPEHLPFLTAAAARGQSFVADGALCLFFTCIPYRMEWRYKEASYKVIAQDSGHAMQNLYLAAASIGCGTCAVATYDQNRCDALLGADGKEEFTLYLAPVGKLKGGPQQ